MAIARASLTEKFRFGVGNRKLSFFQVAHDDSSTTIDAADLDYDVIDFVMFSQGNVASAYAAQLELSVAADGKSILFSEALKTGSYTPLLVIGW